MQETLDLVRKIALLKPYCPPNLVVLGHSKSEMAAGTGLLSGARKWDSVMSRTSPHLVEYKIERR